MCEIVYHIGIMFALTVFSYTVISKEKLTKKSVEYLFCINNPQIYVPYKSYSKKMCNKQANIP